MNENISFGELIEKYDTSDMFSVLKNFPLQVKDACKIGKEAPNFKIKPEYPNFLVLGMGGSAIGGDILKSYISAEKNTSQIRIDVNRNYSYPKYFNRKTNIIASSYSGNTEETNNSLSSAISEFENFICISSGGEISNIAEKNELPLIKIPSGLQPRCALGYSFFPMLYIISNSGLLSSEAKDLIEIQINETLDLIKRKSEIFSNFNNNPAIDLAKKLYGKQVVIYSACERLDSVNTRWRCQIQENAKQLAFGSYLPEMNHNEINSWSFPRIIADNTAIILMRDIDDNQRTKSRFNALKNLLQDFCPNIYEIRGEGKSLLARMFDLIYFGDWVSYYMAILNEIDPTAIPLITKLKNFMAKEV